MNHHRLLVRFAVAFLLTLAAPLGVAVMAQPPRVTILTFGGFLGYLDGLPEAPAGPWDKTPDGPSGGLIGVRRWLEKEDAGQAALRLVTGNNIPRYSSPDRTASPLSADHPFWAQLNLTRPVAIAVGREDIARALSKRDDVSGLVRLASNKDLPFVSSNTFIVAHATGLNRVESHGARLEVGADQSVKLVRQLSVACPDLCTGPTVAVLSDLGVLGGVQQPPSVRTLSAEVEGDKRHWAIPLATAPLRPGHQYQLSVGNATFSFQTMRALTPRTGELPVVRTDTAIITSFAAPDALNDVPLNHREWKTGTAGAAPCLTERCELVVLPPADVWSGLAPLLKEDTATRLLVALTDISDADFRSLSLAAPGLKVMTVHPGSAALGMAAAGTKDTSGDLGYNAVLDRAPSSQLTRVVMRPEWLGETVVRLEAGLGTSPEAARLMDPVVSIGFVEGAALRARLLDKEIQYFVRSMEGGQPVDLEVGGRYQRYASHDPSTKLFGTIPIRNLWTDQNAMIAFLLDLVRAGTHADLAVLDNNAVDDAVTAWLKGAIEATSDVDYLSRFILERAMFRPTRMVRVTVPAAGLAALLEKVIAAGKAFDAAVTISGLGASRGPLARVDADTLKVNGREIEAGHFYSVAMPQRYAVALSEKLLEHPIELDVFFDAADDALLNGTAATAYGGNRGTGTICVTRSSLDPDCPVLSAASPASPQLPAGFLADDLELRHTKSQRWTFNVATATVDLSGMSSKEAGVSALSGVPEDGRDATPFRNFAGSLSGESGVSWQNGVALSVPFAVDYAENRVGRESIKETFPKNLWTVGVKLSKVAHFRPLHVHGVFFSVGVQSNFRRLTASPKSASRPVSSVTDSGGITTVTTETINLTAGPLPDPQRDLNLALGINFENVGGAKARVQLTKIALGVTYAFRYRDLVRLTIAGQTVSADQLAASSVQTIANKLFESDRTSVAADPTLQYGFGQTAYMRVDAGATGKWKVGTNQAGDTTVELEKRYRWYPNPVGQDRLIAARQTLDLKLKMTWPMWRRFQLVASGNAYWLRLRGSGETFQILEYGLKLQFPIFGSGGPGHAHR